MKQARDLLQAGEPDAAWEIVDQVLRLNPNDVPALIMGTSILDKAKRLSVAYQLAKRASELAPNISAVWTNVGRLSEELYQLQDAEKAYRRAVSLSKKPSVLALNLNNLASYYATTGRWDEAEKIANQALEIEPKNNKARGNLGIAQLGLKKWKEGWPNYGAILGSEYRRLVKYRNEPEWDGTPGKSVVIYGEQGLGDEISFASMIPDALKVCSSVVIDCDHRLEGLFRRSFRGAKVYGTRWYKEIKWDEEDTHCDYSITIGQLGGLFRNSDGDFTGEPYLVPDKERHIMWREYLKTKGKPVIGIAWSGGLSWTADRFRRWSLDELHPLFDSVDAHWVSLQYKDASQEIANFKGAEIHQYPFATLSRYDKNGRNDYADYDDTAALVSNCDLVITMQTSVGHLSAAMGIPTWTFVNGTAPQWRYGERGSESCPWYSAMKLFWQKDGKWPIEEAARMLRVRYSALNIRSA